MILDERSEFCDDTACALNTTNALVGDVIDLGATPTLRDIGNNGCLYLVIVSTAGLPDAGIVTFELKSDDTAELHATTATVHATTGAKASTLYGAGVKTVIPVPPSATYERYLGIWQTTSANLTSSFINIYLTTDVSEWTAYADGI